MLDGIQESYRGLAADSCEKQGHGFVYNVIGCYQSRPRRKELLGRWIVLVFSGGEGQQTPRYRQRSFPIPVEVGVMSLRHVSRRPVVFGADVPNQIKRGSLSLSARWDARHSLTISDRGFSRGQGFPS